MAAAEVVMADRGYSRSDLYGVDRDSVTLTERYDMGASLRRACAACGRRRMVKVLSGVAGASTLVAVHTATYAAGIAATLLWTAAIATHTAPDWAFERPAPRWSIGNVQGGGLTDDELAIRMAVMRERDEYREELRDKERKRAERKAKSGGHTSFNPPNPRR